MQLGIDNMRLNHKMIDHVEQESEKHSREETILSASYTYRTVLEPKVGRRMKSIILEMRPNF